MSDEEVETQAQEDQKPAEQETKPQENESKNPELEKALSSLRAMEEQLEQERKQRSELQSKIEEQERAELEKQGNFEKLYKELKANTETKEKNFVLSQAMSAFKQEATKQGCTNVDDLSALMQKDIRKAKVNLADYSVDTEYIANLVSTAKEAKSYLFNKPAPKTDDIPQTKAGQESYTAALKQCKTQKEFDEVRRKFGRI